MSSEAEHQRPTVIRAGAAHPGRAVKIALDCDTGDTSLAPSGPKHGILWSPFTKLVRFLLLAFDHVQRSRSIIGGFLLLLQLLRELIKFLVYFLCQGVTSKDDDDDCRGNVSRSTTQIWATSECTQLVPKYVVADLSSQNLRWIFKNAKMLEAVSA